jgi:hypothetical protein
MLHALATHPGAPAPLLAAIADTLTDPADPTLVRALLTHPATPDPTLEALATGPLPHGGLRALAARDGPLPAPVHRLLATARPGDVIVDVAAATPAQLDRIVTRAIGDVDLRHTLVPAVLGAPAAGPAHHTRLVHALGADPRPVPPVRTWLASLLTHLEPHRAGELAAALARTCPDPDVAADLTAAAAAAGQRARAQDAQIRAVIAANDENGWVAALRTHRARVGELAEHALDRCPTERVVHAVITDPAVPARVRRTLPLRHATCTTDTPGLDDALLLTEPGAAQFCTLVADTATTVRVLVDLLERPTLAPTAVEAAWRRMLTLADQVGDPVDAALVATHPGAPDHVRREALDRLPDATSADRFTRHLAHRALTGTDDDLGRHLPAAALDPRWWAPPAGPGTRRWVAAAITSALAAHLPRVRTDAAARALVYLAPTFTGTVAELVDAATGIAG